MKGVYDTVIIAPRGCIARDLNQCYEDEGYKAFPAGANWQGRAKRIIIMPPPTGMSEDYYKGFEKYVRECAARLIYQGELVRL